MNRKMFLGFMLILCMLLGLLSGVVQTQTPPKAQIAFSSNREGNWDIYVMDADVRNLRNLTHHPADDLTPACSPDGQWVAFASNRDGNYEIYVMDADGKNLHRLTNHPTDNRAPNWSPDGQKLAFQSNHNGNIEIYLLDADGRNLKNLTQHPANDWSPSWSPDGQKVAFTSNRDRNNEIYTMAADGKNPRNLTYHPANDWVSSWSPDGQKLAFLSNRDGNFEIYIMDADGKNPKRLTNHPADERSLSWSSDAQKLAFGSNRDGNFEIYIMEADGSNLKRLTNHPAFDLSPDWLPAERSISLAEKDEATVEQPNYSEDTDLTQPDVLKDTMTEPQLMPGKEVRIELSKAGNFMLVYVPEDYDPSRSWPLIFCYHGRRSLPTTWPFKQVTEGKGFIIVGMEYATQEYRLDLGLNRLEPEKRQFAESLSIVSSRLNVDATKVFMGGFSQGGYSTSFLGEQLLDRLAGLIILGAGRAMIDKYPPPKRSVWKKPIFIGVGQHDNPHNLRSRAAVKIYEQWGAEVTFEEWPDLGHTFDSAKSTKLRNWLFFLAKGSPSAQELYALKRQGESESKMISVGEMIPDFSAIDLDGKTISLKDYRGKVALLYFWASWNKPSVMEIPNLKLVYNKYRSYGFEVIGVNIDNDDSKLREYARNHDIRWRQVPSSQGPNSSLTGKYGIHSLPALWLIDRDGKLIAIQDRGDNLERIVAEALRR